MSFLSPGVNLHRGRNILLGDVGGVPTDPFWSSVILLLQFDTAANSTPIDQSPNANVMTYAGVAGSSIITTAAPPIGTGSLIADGNGGHWNTPAAAPGLNVPGDFTLEWCLNAPSFIGASQVVFTKSLFTSVQPYTVNIDNAGRWSVNGGDGIGTTVYNLADPTGLTVNVNNYCALERFGNVFTIYRNGVPIANVTSASILGVNAVPCCFGAQPNSSQPLLNGIKLDGVRFTAASRYKTLPYAPSSIPFPTSGP